MAYFSCFDVTSVLHDRLSPPGIGFTTSINGEDGPEEVVSTVYYKVHLLEMGLQQFLHYITSKDLIWPIDCHSQFYNNISDVGKWVTKKIQNQNSKFMIFVLSL